jgi:hypothetical protein
LVPQFLSPDWFELLGEALKEASGDLARSERIVIGQIVTGTPSGTVSYALSFGDDRGPQVHIGSVEHATVTFVEDYETAMSIASGNPAGDLLSLGKIKVRGDANALLRAQEELSALGTSLKSLLPETQF